MIRVSSLNERLSNTTQASLGRFLSRDPIGFAGGLNLFSYGANNPVNFVDEDGLHPAVLAGPMIIDTTAAIGAVAAPLFLAGGAYLGTKLAEGARSLPSVEQAAQFLPHHGAGPMTDLRYLSRPWDDASLHPGNLHSVKHTKSLNPNDIPCGEWSTRKVSKRRSETRRKWGMKNVDPQAEIPDQILDGETVHPSHKAKPKTPHPLGERNVGAQEEHSRVAKGTGGRGPRRR